MMLRCNNCGSSGIYLAKKGPQIGAYCAECNRWIKWIGKKDITDFTRKGFKVHEEGFYIRGNATQNDNVPIEQMQIANSAESEEYLYRHHEPNYADAPFEMVPDGSSYSQNNCPLCNSGILPVMTKNSQVLLRVFDNVLTVVDSETGEAITTARLSYCPECGRKLG